MSEDSATEQLSPGDILLRGMGAKVQETEQPKESDESPDDSVNIPDEGQEASEHQEPAKELDFDAQLEKAGLDRKAFYKQLIPGTDKTFGEAKDLLKQESDLETRTAQHELKLRDRENEILQRMREAEVMLNSDNPQQAKAELKRMQEQHETRERAFLMKAIPEWGDATVRQTEQKAIIDLMRGYGFSDAEIGASADHRAIKMMRDFQSLRSILTSAESKKVQAKPKVNPQSRRADARLTGLKKIEADFQAGKLTREEAATLTLLTGLKR